MSTTRSLSVRYAVDAADAKRALESLSTAGVEVGKKLEAGAETARRGLESLARKADAAVESVKRSMDPLYASQQRLADAQRKVDAAALSGAKNMGEWAAQTRVIEQAQARLAAQAQKTSAAVQDHGVAFTKGANGMATMRNAMQGVSMQMQDVVVQLSAGTNPLQVLIQQGGQIAGAFGPAFGPAGLLIAGVGAAAYAVTTLVGATAEAEKAANDHAKAMEDADRVYARIEGSIGDLIVKYRLLGEEMRAVEKTELTRALRTQMEDWQKLRDDFLLGGKDKDGNVLRGFETQLVELSSRNYFGKFRDELKQLRQELANSEDGNPLAALHKGLVQIRQSADGAIPPKAIQALDDMIDRAARNASAMQGTADRITNTKQALEVLGGTYEGVVAASSGAGGQFDAQVQDWLDHQKELTKATEENRKTGEELWKQREQAYDALQHQVETIAAETRELGMSDREREFSIELRKAEALAIKGEIELTDAYIERLRKEVNARYDARKAIQDKEEADRKAKQANDRLLREQERAWQHTIERITDYGADMLFDWFKGTSNGWKGMWEDMKTFALRTIAQIAAQKIVTPVVCPVAGHVILKGN